MSPAVNVEGSKRKGRAFAPRELEFIPHFMARRKTKQEKPAVKIHTITLTADAVEALYSLQSDASDYVGRKVSGGAII